MNISNYAVGTTHLGLPTACYDETVSFYQGLGFTEAFSMTFDDGERLIFLRLKGLLLEIYESSQCAGVPGAEQLRKIRVPGAVDHIAIDVTDIESVFDAIKAEGYVLLDDHVCSMPFWANGEKYFTIQGPNKEKIEFVQIL